MNALQRLRVGQPVFGLMQTFPQSAVTELIAWCGYDFVIIDGEHGVADEAAQVASMQALAGTEAFSLVRVRTQDESAVARYLDFGADGVLVPDVRTPEQARRIAFASRGRWTGGLRGDRYGLDRRTPAERDSLVMVLIESPEGVANVEEILATEGISGAIVGTGDLSTQLGKPGDFKAPDYLVAVDKVEQAARSRGKILGAKPDKEAPLPLLLQRGYRLFMVGRDMPLLRSVLSDTLAAAKKSVPP